MHATFGQSLALVSTSLASALMVRAGLAKGLLARREPRRCASCGRRLSRTTCSCTQR